MNLSNTEYLLISACSEITLASKLNSEDFCAIAVCISYDSQTCTTMMQNNNLQHVCT